MDRGIYRAWIGGGYRTTDNKEFFSSSAVNSRTRRTGRLYMRDVACVLGISWFGWSVQNSGLAEAGYWLLRAAAVYYMGCAIKARLEGRQNEKRKRWINAFAVFWGGDAYLTYSLSSPSPVFSPQPFGNRQADASVHPAHGHCRSHIQHMPIIPFLLFLYFDISICLFFSACNALPVQKNILLAYLIALVLTLLRYCDKILIT